MRGGLFIILALALLSTHAECKPTAKSAAGTAFLQSLVVPGWGQYAQGKRNAALLFFGSELALIGGVYTMKSFSHSAKDDYMALARAYAGIAGDHSHEFYVDIGNWMNTDLFNEQRLRERQYDALYRNEDEQWLWESDARREEFKKVRIRSDRVKNDVVYLAGGLVLNHVVAAIHAARLGSVQAKAEQTRQESQWQFGATPIRGSAGMSLHASLHWR
jgi:hypothetical protein